MATWSEQRGGLTITDEPSPTGDGTNIYYAANTTDIYRYTPGTDTLTQISNAASFDATFGLSTQAGVNLCWFGGSLYCAGIAGSQVQVYQYSGAGTAWTKRLDVAGTGVEVFISDASYLVLGGTIGGVAAGRHSSDGTSWNTSTLPASHIFETTIKTGNETYRGLYTGMKDGPAVDANSTVVLFSAGEWSVVDVLGVRTAYIIATLAKDRTWIYTVSGYQHTTDFNTYTSPVTALTPVPGYNLPYTLAASGGNARYWDPNTGQWSATSEAVGAAPFFYVRATDLTLYALTAGAIYVRSDPLPDPAANARFYFALAGQALAEKFTLPFAKVAPAGLTLDRTLGTVVVGAGEASSQAVVYSAYPYPTGTASAAGFPTGTAITSIRWI